VNLLWVVCLTITAVVAGTSLCFWLLYQAREVATTVWTLEHVLCPIVRIIVLLIVISQVYPALTNTSTELDFWSIVGQQGLFRDLLNILFVAGLLLAFIPVLNHPGFALPLQSMLTIALVFNWQHQAATDSLQLFPSIATLLKIAAYMLLAYFATGELSVPVSRWFDRRLHIEGSIRLVSDAIYLMLQIPVMLIYGGFLKQQLS